MKQFLSIFAIAIAFMFSATGANAKSNNKGNGSRPQCLSSIGVFDTEFGQNPLPMGTYCLNDRHGTSIKLLDDHTFKLFVKDLICDGIELVSIKGQYYEVSPGLYHFESECWSDDVLLDGEDLVTTKCERWYRE